MRRAAICGGDADGPRSARPEGQHFSASPSRHLGPRRSRRETVSAVSATVKALTVVHRSRIDGLLTAHFLRRFLENDLISPDADRLQLLTVVGAGLFSSTLFISTFMSFNYVTVQQPYGQLAVAALNDRFFYLALSMVVVALVAVAQWDALVVDLRDAAILEPLPIRAATVRRAKLAAVAILGGAVALAVNIVPSVVFPWLLVYHTRVSAWSLLLLIVTHLVMTFAAAAFAYLSVIALRETLATVLPARVFARVSPWVQGTLIVAFGTALLMVPPASTDVARRGFEGERAFAPPAWFLGAYETAVGGILADAPRGRLTLRQERADAISTALYERRRTAFPVLARRAALAFGVVALITAAAYVWNARRFAALAPPTAVAVRRRWRRAVTLATTVIVRDSTARAGFFFTMAALWRSNVHRLTIACGAAAGVAMALIALSGLDLQGAQARLPSTRMLSVQPLFYGVLLVAFRHALRVPAELRANWGFQLAWREYDRRFLAGVRRAGLLCLAVPALALTLPLFVYLMGTERALLHAALGFAGAVVFLEIVLVGYTNKVPFTCTYLPNDNMKALAPIYLIAFLIGASSFAGMQRAALQDPGGIIRLLLFLAIIYVMLRVASVRLHRPELVDFNEAPVTTQRLGLNA